MIIKINDKRGLNWGSGHYLLLVFFPIINQRIKTEEDKGMIEKTELPKYKTHLIQQDSIKHFYV